MIWPTVEAIAVVPLSAHALFAKPLVVGPEHAVAIEVLERTNGTGILWCDGRRSHDLPPGARVVVRRSDRPVRLARLHPAAFTDRLVRKFRLPVEGWRGPDADDTATDAVIEEMRLRDLGVIAEATLPIGPGFTAITGETGAGKTMVVTGLGLLLGQRADSGAVRAGAAQASVDGVWIVPEHGAVADRVREAGGDVEPLGDGTRRAASSAASVSSEGRSRATVGGRAAPAGVLADLADELVVVHGQSDQLRLRSAAAQRDALDRFGGAGGRRRRSTTYRAAYEHWRAIERELTRRSPTDRDARAAEAERAARRSSPRSSRPRRSRARTPSSRCAPSGSRTPRSCALAAATAHDALSGDGDAPDAGVAAGRGAPRARARARPRPRRARRAGRRPRLSRRRSRRVARGLPRRSRRDRARTSSPPSRIAARCSAALIRTHGIARRGDRPARDPGRRGSPSSTTTATASSGSPRERDAAASALDAAAAALTAARTAAAARLGAAVTAELHALAMPDARLDGRGHAGRRVGRGPRRRRDPARAAPRRRTATRRARARRAASSAA